MVIRYLNLQEKQKELDEWKAKQPPGSVILSIDPEEQEG
jgi:hypothetical protein